MRSRTSKRCAREPYARQGAVVPKCQEMMLTMTFDRGNTEQFELLEEVFKDVPGLFEGMYEVHRRYSCSEEVSLLAAESVFEEKLYDLMRQTITLAKVPYC